MFVSHSSPPQWKTNANMRKETQHLTPITARWRWAKKYASDYADWGCTAQDKVTDLLAETFQVHGSHAPSTRSVLDAGCGVGLHGEHLTSAGFGPLTGIDLSKEMLKKAMATGHYANCLKTDLSAPLKDHEDNQYDAATCIAVLTYIDPSNSPCLLEELARVVKPGGAVVFSHRPDMHNYDEWAQKAQELEAAGKWKLFKQSGPHSYLPDSPDLEFIRFAIFSYIVQ